MKKLKMESIDTVLSPLESDLSATNSFRDANNTTSAAIEPAHHGNLLVEVASKFTTQYRIHLNILKTVFEIVPSLYSIHQLALNLNGACVSGLPHYCDMNTGSGDCQCLPSKYACGGPYTDDSTGSPYVSCPATPSTCSPDNCHGWYANPCSYDDNIKRATYVQVILSVLSCAFEIFVLVLTVSKLQKMHNKWVYIFLNTALIALQVAFCLYLSAYSGDFGFTTEVLILVIASKLIAVMLGTAHLAYLVPIGTKSARYIVACLKYGIEEE